MSSSTYSVLICGKEGLDLFINYFGCFLIGCGRESVVLFVISEQI